MQQINILYVITKLELGGAQKQLLSLIRHLNKEKFRPFLFTAKEGLLLSEALSINGLTLSKSRCLERAINPFKDLLALIEIYQFIKKNNIGIVHTYSSKAGIVGRFAARLAKTKIVIHTVHGWSFNDYQPLLWRTIAIWLERLVARFTNKLIMVSHHDKQRGLVHHIGIEDKYSIIRYGIDYKEFDTAGQGIKKELGIDHNDLIVVMVACFKPQKSPQDFIRLAFLIKQTMPNIKFILAGDGVLRPQIESLIEKFNLKQEVILTGWRRDIARILSIADVFVLTSLWEGLPITVLEAMAAAKPVVATDTGGIKEIAIDGKTGFIVHPQNIKKMAEKAVVLLKDANLRKQMGLNARDSLDFNFTFENMVKSSEDLYIDLVRQKESLYVN